MAKDNSNYYAILALIFVVLFVLIVIVCIGVDYYFGNHQDNESNSTKEPEDIPNIAAKDNLGRIVYTCPNTTDQYGQKAVGINRETGELVYTQPDQCQTFTDENNFTQPVCTHFMAVKKEGFDDCWKIEAD